MLLQMPSTQCVISNEELLFDRQNKSSDEFTSRINVDLLNFDSGPISAIIDYALLFNVRSIKHPFFYVGLIDWLPCVLRRMGTIKAMLRQSKVGLGILCHKHLNMHILEIIKIPVLYTTPSSLAKGFVQGPLSLHPWQIELEFRIHALSISIECSYY